jgi:hypothetical protein
MRAGQPTADATAIGVERRTEAGAQAPFVLSHAAVEPHGNARSKASEPKAGTGWMDSA